MIIFSILSLFYLSEKSKFDVKAIPSGYIEKVLEICFSVPPPLPLQREISLKTILVVMIIVEKTFLWLFTDIGALLIFLISCRYFYSIFFFIYI